MKKIIFKILFPILFLSPNLKAQKYVPTAENLEAREWFQNARFGLFIHWGVYSILADGEWVMNNQNISISEYEKLPSFFNPIDFDPAEWVTMVKEAGMKYITITSRHHDGFSMFDTKMSDYNIVQKTIGFFKVNSGKINTSQAKSKDLSKIPKKSRSGFWKV